MCHKPMVGTTTTTTSSPTMTTSTTMNQDRLSTPGPSLNQERSLLQEFQALNQQGIDCLTKPSDPVNYTKAKSIFRHGLHSMQQILHQRQQQQQQEDVVTGQNSNLQETTVTGASDYPTTANFLVQVIPCDADVNANANAAQETLSTSHQDMSTGGFVLFSKPMQLVILLENNSIVEKHTSTDHEENVWIETCKQVMACFLYNTALTMQRQALARLQHNGDASKEQDRAAHALLLKALSLYELCLSSLIFINNNDTEKQVDGNEENGHHIVRNESLITEDKHNNNTAAVDQSNHVVAVFMLAIVNNMAHVHALSLLEQSQHDDDDHHHHQDEGQDMMYHSMERLQACLRSLIELRQYAAEQDDEETSMLVPHDLQQILEWNHQHYLVTFHHNDEQTLPPLQ